MDNRNNKTFIGIFYMDSDLLDKIEELKSVGYINDNIYVIAKNETDLSMLRSRTAADMHAAYHSWTDRFISFLTGENHIKQLMYDVGMNEDEVNRYYEEIQHGGMLLYVDEGRAFHLYSKNEPFYTAVSTPAPAIEPSTSNEPEQSFSQLQHFEEAEPSYGGYEPLKNPIHPECVSRFTREKGITPNKTQEI